MINVYIKSLILVLSCTSTKSFVPYTLLLYHHYSLSLNRFYLGIYVVINIGIAIFALSRELYARLRSWSAGRTLFREMLSAVLYAPMSFFDTTPLGRIVNRFSKVICRE